MLQKIKKIINIIDMTGFGISMIGLAGLSFAAVIFRFFFQKPIIWVEEIQMILVVWSVFFGASIAVREKDHMAVELIYDILPFIGKRILDILSWIVTAATMVALIYLMSDRVGDLIKSGLRTAVLGLPSYIEYAVVVFTVVLMLVNHIISGVEALTQKAEKEEAIDG